MVKTPNTPRLQQLIDESRQNEDEYRCRHAGRHVRRFEAQVKHIGGRRWLPRAVEVNVPEATDFEGPGIAMERVGRLYWFRWRAERAAARLARADAEGWEVA